MVPKKSSTNFCTVPFVDSKRVRKISGMDLQQDVNIVLIILIILTILIILIIIIILIAKIIIMTNVYLCERGMEASMELRRWSGLTRW